MMKPLRRVAVLGAGTMGSRIAAHFANAGFPVDLLDVVIADQPNRNAAAVAGIDTAARQKIENQRRTILEGTQEWDILYRKYYNEEVKKLGI
jgi:3-hydroxyacyl-CoA dehydrogenase